MIYLTVWVSSSVNCLFMSFEEFLFCVIFSLLLIRFLGILCKLEEGLYLAGLIFQCDEMSLQLTLLISLLTAYPLFWMNYLFLELEVSKHTLCCPLWVSFLMEKKVQDACTDLLCAMYQESCPCGGTLYLSSCARASWVIPIQNKVFNNSFDCRSKTMFALLSTHMFVCLLLVRKRGPLRPSLSGAFTKRLFIKILDGLETPMRVVVFPGLQEQGPLL